MNTKTLLAAMVGLGLALSASAQTVTNRIHTAANQAIPDDDGSGISSIVPVLNLNVKDITGVRVFLNISGDFNGDLYAYLRHDTQFAVLLNRVGRTTSATFGYGDPGLNIILSDGAAGDIHLYRGATPNTPLTAALTGEWQPDGRNVAPATVLDTAPRTAMLSVFNHTDATRNGDWTLFIADVSGSGASTLVSWDLEIVGVVPEPSALALIGLGLVAILVRRRKL